MKIFIRVFFASLALSSLVGGLSFSPISFPKAFDKGAIDLLIGKSQLSALSIKLSLGVTLEIVDTTLYLRGARNGAVFVFRNEEPLNLAPNGPGVSIMQGDFVAITHLQDQMFSDGLIMELKSLGDCFMAIGPKSCIEERLESDGNLIFGTTIVRLNEDEAIQSRQMGLVINSRTQWVICLERKVGNLKPAATIAITPDNQANLRVLDGACIFVIRKGVTVRNRLNCNIRLVARPQKETRSTLRLERGDVIILVAPKSVSATSKPWNTAISPFRMNSQDSLEEKTRIFSEMNPDLDIKVGTAVSYTVQRR